LEEKIVNQVAAAKQALKLAEADAAIARKVEAKRQLEEVRATARTLKRELDAIVAAVKRGDGERLACDREIAFLNEEIRGHIANQLDPASFPSQAELDNWQKELEQLIVERDKAVGRKRAIRGGDRLRAIQLDAEITRLRYSAENLSRIVRGELVADETMGGGGLRFVS
jgi:hypothetical protein